MRLGNGFRTGVCLSLFVAAFAGCAGEPAQDADASVAAIQRGLSAADCPAGYRVLQGTAGADRLNGTSGNDCIVGLAGNDTINGYGGNDFILGGEGHDVIAAGAGDDTVYGEDGDDNITGGTGRDVLEGGTGRDHLRGGDHNDTLRGGADADVLHGDGYNDTLEGGDGDDVLDGDASADVLRGGNGDDALYGDGGNDQLFGDAGDDALLGGSGTNTIDGGIGTDACAGAACEKPALSLSGCTADSQCSSGSRCIVDFGLCLGCVSDQDGDLICDSKDGCATDAAKSAPGICGCGISDQDTDGDLTSDCVDGCPNHALKTSPGQCGCESADTDTDNDGSADCVDGCPSDANKALPGVCGCGVVDLDSDGDGAMDCQELCDSDPAKTTPGACGCNRPDVDTDGDGTADCRDLCPRNPAKVEPNDCGCSVDVDSDGDGVLDCVDQCPGYDDRIDENNNGRPDLCETPVGCTYETVGRGVFRGDVSLSDAESLQQLSGITCIAGSLRIGNSSLSSLEGLESLRAIAGELYIEGNEQLVHLAGLEGLTSVDALQVYSNPGLETLQGLNGLTFVGRQLSIWGNPNLRDISALSGLTPESWSSDLAEPSIADNASLPMCQVWELTLRVERACYSCVGNTGQGSCGTLPPDFQCVPGASGPGVWDGDLNVQDSTQFDATGLKCVTGDLYISANIEDARMFRALEKVGGSLRIELNYNLTTLAGLESLNEVGGALVIESNDLLADISALGNLTRVGNSLEPGMDPIHIRYNRVLPQCQAWAIAGQVGQSCLGENNWPVCEYNEGDNDTANCPSLPADFACVPGAVGPGVLDGDLRGLIPRSAQLGDRNFARGVRCVTGDVDASYEQDLMPLSELQKVGGKFTLTTSGAVNVDPLDELVEIGGFLEIWNNAELQNLAGLRNLRQLGASIPDEISAFYISENPLLPSCWVWTLAAQTGRTCGHSSLSCVNATTGSCGSLPADFACVPGAQGPGVYPGDLTLREGDPPAYAGVTCVTGTVRVEAPETAPLSTLTKIGGDLIIENQPSLRDVDGLSSLTHVAGVAVVERNDVLEDLNGLRNLRGSRVGVADNAQLANCWAWGLLQAGNVVWFDRNFGTSSCGTLPPGFVCEPGAVGPGVFDASWDVGYQRPEDLSGLTCYIGDLYISQTDLTDLTTLSHLQQVSGQLLIYENSSLRSLAGLENLSRVSDMLWITQNPELNDLTGLSSLTHVGGGLNVSYNAALTNVAGLSNLSQVGALTIYENPALQSLAGLSSLSSIGQTHPEWDNTLWIAENASLPACWVDQIEAQTSTACTNCQNNAGTGSCAP